MTTDVVVCAHNEADRIEAVLSAIAQSPSVGQLLVVCDACDDDTPALAARYGTAITIGEQNKGTAMAVGLRFVATPNVLFMDADLTGLQPGHVTAMCVLPPLDGMLVGVRGNLPSGITTPNILAAWPSISGERRLPTAFVRSLHIGGKGWTTETRINAAVATAGLPHRQIVLKGVGNPRKMSPLKVVKEWVEVAGITSYYAPTLARYAWSEQ